MATTLELSYIPTYNLNTIAFADISHYDSAPVNPSFEVTVPGFSKSNITFVPGVVNIFDTSTIGIGVTDNTIPLPDGIYTVKYSIFPNTTLYTERSFMRTAIIENKLERLFLAIDMQCTCNGHVKSKLKEQLRDIELLVDGSIASANQCDTTGAYDLYAKANNLIDKIKPCNC